MNIGIYIYDEAEVLDFSGPFEVFSTASRLSEDNKNPFSVFMISQSGHKIKGRGGYSVNPSYGFDNHPKIDVLIVVGGVHTHELTKTPVISLDCGYGKRSKVGSFCMYRCVSFSRSRLA